VGTLIFLSKAEIAALAKSAAPLAKDKKKLDAKKLFAACKSAPLSDAADIAIFGRMVAKGPDLTLEGAAMFSHALSTHMAENNTDFFAAVDDEKLVEEDSGAGHTNVLEFTSAVYYRYLALNLGLLADRDHLGSMSRDERCEIVNAFLRAAILAVPGARKNSMNANVDVAYVLGVAKNSGQPIQMVNAFEQAVPLRDGYVKESVRRMLLHFHKVQDKFSLPKPSEFLATGTEEPELDEKLARNMIPESVNLDTFCSRLVKHVI
jgi:CRISPR system Cascade subunit CasC